MVMTIKRALHDEICLCGFDYKLVYDTYFPTSRSLSLSLVLFLSHINQVEISMHEVMMTQKNFNRR